MPESNRDTPDRVGSQHKLLRRMVTRMTTPTPAQFSTQTTTRTA